MADTTWPRILAIAPELEVLPSATKDIILEDVIDCVTEDAWGTCEEKAQRFLAAHMGTMYREKIKNVAGAISSKSVGGVSVSYSASSLRDGSRYDTTLYGQQYMSLRKGCFVAFRVIKP